MDRLVRRAVDSTSRSCSVSKASLLETLGKAITALARPGPALKFIALLTTLGVLASLPANALITPTAAVGATPGSFAVSPSGAATYTIPIVVAPGTNGMQPNLALVYNSQGGNGLLGMGWSLAGLSVIHRCGATIEIDGFKGGVNYDGNDRFCLDGERLINVGGNEYRTQRESLQRVVAGALVNVNDPSDFTVRDKDGTIREYGKTVDSRIEAQGKGIARLWALNRITDKNGNTLSISYTEDNANGDYRAAPGGVSPGPASTSRRWLPKTARPRASATTRTTSASRRPAAVKQPSMSARSTNASRAAPSSSTSTMSMVAVAWWRRTPPATTAPKTPNTSTPTIGLDQRYHQRQRASH